jgi:hypothetical protein
MVTNIHDREKTYTETVAKLAILPFTGTPRPPHRRIYLRLDGSLPRPSRAIARFGGRRPVQGNLIEFCNSLTQITALARLFFVLHVLFFPPSFPSFPS